MDCTLYLYYLSCIIQLGTFSFLFFFFFFFFVVVVARVAFCARDMRIQCVTEKSNETRHEKTCLRVLQPGKTKAATETS